jgi:hypothetical protein
MGKKEEGGDKADQVGWIGSDAPGGLTANRGGLTARHTVPGGQTGPLWRSDRLLLALVFADLIHNCTNKIHYPLHSPSKNSIEVQDMSEHLN